MKADLDKRRLQGRTLYAVLTVISALFTINFALAKQPAFDILGAAGVTIVSLNLLVQNEFGDSPVDMSLALLPLIVGFFAYLVRTLCSIEAHDFGLTVQTLFAALMVLIEAVLDAGFLLLAAGRLVFDRKV